MTDQSVCENLLNSSDLATGAVPKLCGADVELGNFLLGGTPRSDFRGTGLEAALLLFREMPGLHFTERSHPDQHDGGRSWSIPHAWGTLSSSCEHQGQYGLQSWGRKFIPANGGCSYIDHSHLELCLPETLSAFDSVAAWYSMLHITRSALERANSKLPQGIKIKALVNNSDGQGNSYGSHTNFLVSRRCFQNIFERKLHYGLFLASYLTSSIILTGAGKVGSENGRPPVDFQIAQRADFFESLMGSQTTYRRPIVNSRDEAHSAGAPLARLHVIFFDSTMCHVSSLLKVGSTQIVLAMIEQDQVASDLILQEPLEAVVSWSHDPDLRSKGQLISGAKYTAAEIQLAILERARKFVSRGRADGIVPFAGEILALWEDTLLKLEARDFEALLPRLDWVMKRSILERAIEQHPQLTWNSPQLKHLDLLYSSLDKDGLYWVYEPDFVEKLVSAEAVNCFIHAPPNDTRAWLRSYLLSRASERIDSVDWDYIRFRFQHGGDGHWPRYSYKTLRMNPLIARRECEPAFNASSSLEEALEMLGVEETDRYGRPIVHNHPPGPAVYIPSVTALHNPGEFEREKDVQSGQVRAPSGVWPPEQ